MLEKRNHLPLTGSWCARPKRTARTYACICTQSLCYPGRVLLGANCPPMAWGTVRRPLLHTGIPWTIAHNRRRVSAASPCTSITGRVDVYIWKMEVWRPTDRRHTGPADPAIVLHTPLCGCSYCAPPPQ